MFFRDLCMRGLHGVRLVITDLRYGIRTAVAQAFGNASWQVCNLHLLRSVADLMTKPDARTLAREFSLMKHAGSAGYDDLVTRLREMGYGQAVSLLEEYRVHALAYREFPRDHWKSIYTTNPIENVNSVLKRRLRATGSFPSDAAVMRLAGALLLQLEETVFSGTTYLYGMAAVWAEEQADDGADSAYGTATFETYRLSEDTGLPLIFTAIPEGERRRGLRSRVFAGEKRITELS